MNAALNSSERHDWRTPAEVVQLLVEFWGHMPELDPCASVVARDQCELIAVHNLPEESDGLSADWLTHGGHIGTYVNPPYGRALKAWTQKMVTERCNGCEIIALVPARTDTRWFRMLFDNCAAVCFWSGRITFVDAPGPAPFPSALFYLGTHPRRFESVFREKGIVIRP